MRDKLTVWYYITSCMDRLLPVDTVLQLTGRGTSVGAPRSWSAAREGHGEKDGALAEEALYVNDT